MEFYCINLSQRPDRRLKAQQEFDRLRIPVTWWTVDRHPQGGKYGCFESHVNIWMHNNSDIIVVFEDDIQFNGDSHEFRKIIEEAVYLSEFYDMVCLGNVIYNSGRRVSTNFREGKFLTASAYLSRGNTLRLLSQKILSFYGNHLDVVLSQIASQVGYIDSKFNQDFTDSNNSWLQDIPILSCFPGLDRHIRNILDDNPNIFTKPPPILLDGIMKCILGLCMLQQSLPRILYGTGVEFTDRRV